MGRSWWYRLEWSNNTIYMKALILSAGGGTRLGKLKKKIPKPMITVCNYPVLEHLVFHLSKFGITQIMVNLHYKPEVIMNYFGTGLLYSYEPTLLGEKEFVKYYDPTMYWKDIGTFSGLKSARDYYEKIHNLSASN